MWRVWVRGEVCTGFWLGNLRKESIGETQTEMGGYYWMALLEVGGGVDWMALAQDRDKWRALVNKVMNFPDP